MDHWRSQRGNQKPGGKWKVKHNDSNLFFCSKEVLRGKFIALKDYFRKQGKSQINNLSLHLQIQEKKNKQNTKLVEGNKS